MRQHGQFIDEITLHIWLDFRIGYSQSSDTHGNVSLASPSVWQAAYVIGGMFAFLHPSLESRGHTRRFNNYCNNGQA